MNQNEFEKEISPLLMELLEKAREKNAACLLVVEVDGVMRISGNLLDTFPRLTEAFFSLLEESEQQPDWHSINNQAEIDLAAITTDQDAYRFIETYLSKGLRPRLLAIYHADRHEMDRTPRQSVERLLKLPPL